MTSNLKRIPNGPAEKYDPSVDLLEWLSHNFSRYGDMYRASIYGADVYVASHPRYADHVLRVNWQNYRKGQSNRRVGFLLGNGLMVSEGEFWKTQRQMIQPVFHETAVAALFRAMQAANIALLHQWEQTAQKAASVNLTKDISRMVLDLVLLWIFGEDCDRMEPHFRVLSEEPARNLQLVQTFKSFRGLVLEVIAQRRSRNRFAEDILGMLLGARDRQTGRAMPDGQLVSEILTLIVAGHETTASTLNWTWYLLSQNPAAEEKLTAELAALTAEGFPGIGDLHKFVHTGHVLEEVLRLYPAGWLMTRRALNDDQLGDYFLPAGAEVYISPYLIQRNPALWDRPDSFDPDRFDSALVRERCPLSMLPFSAGPRKCIGESFARIEMQVHLIMVAANLHLQYAGANPMELDVGVNLRGKSDFIMFPVIRGTNRSQPSGDRPAA